MSSSDSGKADERLSILLKAGKPVGELRPGFATQVWHRIEQGEAKSTGLIEQLTSWLMQPRFAFGMLTAIVLLGAILGGVKGAHSGETAARERYLSMVDPIHTGH
jgi:hypothetical protein